MYFRTYISKFNTIIQDSNLNTGLNPIAELNYGSSNSRIVLYFDHRRVKSLLDDKVITDIKKCTHRLKITNSGSLDFTQMHDCQISSITDNMKKRACSFDLIFFLVPKFWDSGKGFSYTKNFLNTSFYANDQIDKQRLMDTNGCTWYQPRNNYKWDEDGIYSIDTLSREYDNFSSNKGSDIIIGRQHFDFGNENIDLDITEIMNKFIEGELENYGIGIAFTPMTENTQLDHDEYIGFLTNKTNLFFEPYVETYYDDFISDDRSYFSLNKHNRLYLYSTINSHLTSLDELPTCKIIDGNDEPLFEDLEVKEQFKGTYYVDVNLNSKEFDKDTMFYDVWDNIKYKGNEFDSVELNFTTKSPVNFFNFGNPSVDEPHFTPVLSGIKENEQIKRGDIRKIVALFKQNYNRNEATLMDDVKFRLYILDGTREYDIIPFDCMHKTNLETYYTIDTNELVPQKYYVDIMINHGMESIIHHNVLHFDIIDDINNKYV